MKSKKIPFINRELSWLSFNERVLQEAEDKSNPALERLRFLGIYSNNRDEFFRVRVATMKRMVKLGKKAEEFIGGNPERILEQIQSRVIAASKRFDVIYNQILKELEKSHIHIINEKEVSKAHHNSVVDFFNEKVLPCLFPIMIDTAPSFPYLKDKSIYLAIKLVRKEEKKKTRYALIEVPTDQVSRFVVLPSLGKEQYVMLLEDVIRYNFSKIFSAREYATIESYTIKMTRDAELDLDNDLTKSLMEKISGGLKKRKKGVPVRFVYDKEMPDDLLSYLLKKLKVIKSDNIIPGSRYHNFKDFINFPDLGHKELVWPKEQPLSHPRFVQGESMFKTIREKDILLHYPYQSFHHIIDLLREASIDPKVSKIYITIYRVASQSNICNSLINAIKNGKQVTVVMELQARFDEENNINWANRLVEEGARVIYGVPGLKVHSKLMLIVRNENNKNIHYAHIGTGNFNENTSRIYTDKTLLTADKRITSEVLKVFEFYEDNLKPGSYKHLLVSPFSMRRKLNALIQQEIENARKKKPAWIILKMNNLVDLEMIAKLYEASAAGVKIKLLIRGICSLVPGIPVFSENIEVFSLLGKYLEHSRVFVFCNLGEAKYFISSADWMNRNLDRRSEVAVPVYDKEAQKELQDILNIQFSDNRKLRIIGGSKENSYVAAGRSHAVYAQHEIRNYLKKLSGGISQLR